MNKNLPEKQNTVYESLGREPQGKRLTKVVFAVPLAFSKLLYQSIFLALAQIWANKTRSTLTTIGIVIGVASVTAVIASLTGLKTNIMDDFESFGTNKIYINIRRPKTGPMANVDRWQLRFVPSQFDNLLEHCPSVEQFARASWAGEQTVRYADKTVEGVRLFGVEPEWSKIENQHIVNGRLFSAIDETQSRNVCLVETGLRDELNLDKDCSGEFVLIGSRSFRIVGVIEKRVKMAGFTGDGGGEYWEIFIPFSTNAKYRQPWMWAIATSKSTGISEEARAEINFFLRKTRRIMPGDPDTFRVRAVESEIKKFNEIAKVTTAIASGVVGISLLVGGIGIMNIMLVSVSERTREIGLRKAVGAKSSAILTQFLVEAVVLCFMGGLIGVGLGQLLTLGLANIPNAKLDQAYIPAWAIALSFGFAGFVGIFFGMFPAIKAAKLDPIEALRHE